jgi:peptidoglycan-associated lipoprotein
LARAGKYKYFIGKGKKMKYQALITVGLAAFVVAASGCASKANLSGDIGDEETPPIPVPVVVAPPPEPPVEDVEVGELRTGILGNRLIYFGYDQSVVSSEDLSLIQAHSDYLNRNSSSRVILEGHADDRGSNEYNLALGQRRATAVRDIMLANGVRRDQIETLSFGEESPRAYGENESAWAQNRRVEIRYHHE